jgi:hypothetical protein
VVRESELDAPWIRAGGGTNQSAASSGSGGASSDGSGAGPTDFFFGDYEDDGGSTDGCAMAPIGETPRAAALLLLLARSGSVD